MTDLNDCLKVEGASIHIYGKKDDQSLSGKMGHVTILDKSIKNALDKANFIKTEFKGGSMKKALVSILMGSDSDLCNNERCS